MTALQVLGFTLLPAAGTMAASIAAMLHRAGPTTRTACQRFAAGVVFAVVGADLIPHVMHELSAFDLAWSFGLAVLLTLGVRMLTHRLEKREQGGAREWIGLIAGLTMDNLVQGLVLGAGFATTGTLGRLLALAATIEEFSVSLATSFMLDRAGVTPKKIAGLTAVVALPLPLGGLAAATVLRDLSHHALAVLLSFALASVLYLVMEELLAEVHEDPGGPWLVGLFFAGFLLFLVVQTAT